MTIEELNERIDKSMEDSQKGRLIKASDLKAKMEKWDQRFIGLKSKKELEKIFDYYYN